MPRRTRIKKKRLPGVVVVLAVVVVAGLFGLWFFNEDTDGSVNRKEPEKVRIPIKNQPVINYNRLAEDQSLKDLMRKRKDEYGIDNAVDIIVKPNETVEIGDSKISMERILEQIRLKYGDIIEKDLVSAADDPKRQNGYGIYVIQPKDNIWNIHFEFLKDYFKQRGLELSPQSDEPGPEGLSTGIGKVLKFSENMACIFNLKEKRLDDRLHIIQPMSKIIVYNMKQVFALLDNINLEGVNRIMFDGENLWIAAD